MLQGVSVDTPTKKEMIARWRRVQRLAEKLSTALGEVEHDLSDVGSDLSDRVCSSLLAQAEGWIDAYERTPRQRRPDNDPLMASLFRELFKIWLRSGGALKFSRGAREAPVGALSPAYAAGLRRLSDEQLARLIRKERQRREVAD
jgi:hypothetical protein